MKRFFRCAFAVLLVFGVFLIPLAALAASGDAPVSVASIVFARSVESREPVDASKEFEASVARVFCWTKLSAKNPPVTVKHVWYKSGRKLLEVPWTLSDSSGRYWSVKNVSSGDWTVEVVGADGEVLGSASFKVK